MDTVHSEGSSRHYTASRLRLLTSLAAMTTEPERYLVDHRRRRIEFLTSLINPGDDRVTYDLRLIAQPDHEVRERGRIVLALLCRVEPGTAAEAQAAGQQLFDLLDAYFDEYVFEPVSAEQIKGLLSPFRVEHVAAIARRTSFERLDTLRGGYRRLSPGFLPQDSRPEPDRRSDEILHVFPYLPSSATPLPLFRLLLSQPHPIAVSFRLRPTTLLAEEESFIEGQIARCERYAQLGLERSPDDVTLLQPALREQAQVYQRFQNRMLLGLKDNAALMTVEVASPGPIPRSVLNVLGSVMTEPAGGGSGDRELPTGPYLAGGYEVVADAPELKQALQELDVVPREHPIVSKPAGRLLHLFDSVEATAGFLLPPAPPDDVPGFEVQRWRSLAAPKNLPDRGSILGLNVNRASSRIVRIAPEDRRRHLYVLGQTGTGKTTLLKTLILEDMRAGEGLCVIDPHGDLFHELLGRIPANRVDDVVVLDPTDIAYPVGLNMLEFQTETQRHFLAQEVLGIVMKLVQDEFGSEGLGEIAGPMFHQHARMNLLLTMSNPDDPGTLLEFYTIYQEPEYWRRWLPLRLSDPLLDRWVENILPRVDYTKAGSEGTSMGGYVGSKFEGFVFDPLLRYLFGQKRSTIDLRRVMDEGKILLVNLAKGELTEPNSRFLGMVLLAKLIAAAMGRVGTPERERRTFHLYVDEFQSVATQSFVTLLSEARKFGVSLVLANQFLTQIRDERIIRAIFGNVGTLISFRLGQADAELMEREFLPVTRADLVNLPNWHAYMSALVDGQAATPFSLQTVNEAREWDTARAREARDRSRTRYGRPRSTVEAEIAGTLQRGEG